MKVHTFTTADEGKKGWFAVGACRWAPHNEPSHLEVRLAGSDVRVKAPLEHTSTDVIGIGWVETRRWRGVDPTASKKTKPPPLSTPSSSRKRGSSVSDTTHARQSSPRGRPRKRSRRRPRAAARATARSRRPARTPTRAPQPQRRGRARSASRSCATFTNDTDAYPFVTARPS